MWRFIKPVMWILATPPLVLMGGFFLLTGSLIPYWYIEKLENPHVVQTISEDGLLVATGKQVKLPYLSRIPADDPVFIAAVREGIEIDALGEVFGLLEVRGICGNDPVVYRKLRLNLTDLAGALDPNCISKNASHPDAIRILSEMGAETQFRDGSISAHFLSKMRMVRRDLTFFAGAPAELPLPQATSNGHQLRTGFLAQ